MTKTFITRSKEERNQKIRILEAFGNKLVKDFDFNILNEEVSEEIDSKILKNRINELK